MPWPNNLLFSEPLPTKIHSNQSYGEHLTSSPPTPTNGLTTAATASCGQVNTDRPTNASALHAILTSATTTAVATTPSTRCPTTQPNNPARGASQKPSDTPPNQKFYPDTINNV